MVYVIDMVHAIIRCVASINSGIAVYLEHQECLRKYVSKNLLAFR